MPRGQIHSTVTIARPVDEVFGFFLALGFEEADGGTKVTFRGDSNPVWPFKPLSPVFNRKGQQVWDERLARVKRVLEAERP